MSFTDENRKELEVKGYTVVKNVLTEEECDIYINQYKVWLKSNFAPEEFPNTVHSLVQRYSIGHLEPTWHVRMKSRGVFAQVWGTERLLTSVDAVAIGRPPEDGQEMFYEEMGGWLHLDQRAVRQGLHAYQGAVYLEQADEGDWTFEVMESSHRYFDEYFSSQFDAFRRAAVRGHAKTRDEHFDWLANRGCVKKRVPVPKGGMVLWDSRLVHANARPLKGRINPGRWRWVVMTCMAPACWATKKALRTKREAYEKMLMTTHWPCDDVGLFPATLPSYAAQELHPLKELPDAAQSVEAKRMMGVLPYPPLTEREKERERELMSLRPKWHPDYLPKEFVEDGSWRINKYILSSCGIMLLVAMSTVWVIRQ